MRDADPSEPRHLRAPPVENLPMQAIKEPSLADYLGIVVGARWLISATTLLAVCLGTVYVLVATPRYRSDILVQVEEKAQGLGFDEMSGMFSGKAPADTEMEIIRSRSLVGAVVDELSLDIVTRPRLFPLIGGGVARLHDGLGPRAPVLGLAKYAWGGERLVVSRLNVPDILLGKPLTLTAREGGRFTLRGPKSSLILDGQMGAPASGNDVSLFVTDLHARPGTEFVVMRQRRAKVVDELQQALQISERGKKTGILHVSLEGAEPRRIAAILDAVSRSYLRQNVERKSAEAQKTLEFLETQLPQLRKNVELSEAKLESYRATAGSVDVSLETQATLARSVELEKALSELEVERSELKQRFTESHPALAIVQDKMAQLGRERAVIEQRFRKLPQAEMDSARLMRDAKVANELYILLLNKSQELRVVKSGTIGNIRILDAAIEPIEPVSPKKAKAMALSLVLGLAFGVGLAFVRSVLTRGLEDPEAVERDTGLAVYASIPRSHGEIRLERSNSPSKVLAIADPGDVAVESFRSLRTSLQFALIEASSRIISVLGPAPTIGKSFCSANLGAVLAESGKRVIVVDGDLRKGRLHKYFGGRRVNGLSELISGAAGVDGFIRKTACENLDFIATGRVPPNPAGLLGSDRFGTVLADLALRYDFVVIDTPPVLAVTDAVLVARHSGINLLVLRAGKHPLREIVAALRRFEQGGVEVHGAVLNDVEVRTGYANYGGYHYQYSYSSKGNGK